MGRPTAEDRRRDYLAAGAEILAEFDRGRAAEAPVDALANVRLADVARRAGVTKGALYHIWESQEAFRQDLLGHLLETEYERGLSDTVAEFDHTPPGEDVDGSMERLTRFAFDRLKDDPGFAARFSFYTYGANPVVRDLLLSTRDRFGGYYELYLQVTGRRLRAPFTIDHVVTLVEAYLFGSIMRYRISPDLVDVERTVDGRVTGLVPLGMRALLEGLSEPDPGSRGD